MLIGTDFNTGVKGIGPKKALKLVREYGGIEAMPEEIRGAVGEVEGIRRIYLEPQTTIDYDISAREPDFDGVVKFLCEEREFSADRVRSALDRAFRERTLW